MKVVWRLRTRRLPGDGNTTLGGSGRISLYGVKLRRSASRAAADSDCDAGAGQDTHEAAPKSRNLQAMVDDRAPRRPGLLCAHGSTRPAACRALYPLESRPLPAAE